MTSVLKPAGRARAFGVGFTGTNLVEGLPRPGLLCYLFDPFAGPVSPPACQTTGHLT
jgi:hypothetical protein